MIELSIPAFIAIIFLAIAVGGTFGVMIIALMIGGNVDGKN